MSVKKHRWTLLALIVLNYAFCSAQISTSAKGLKEMVLHSFGGPDGSAPEFAPITDKTGTLYGGSLLGGSHDCGTVFKMTPNGFAYDETVLHSFTGSDGFGVWGIVEDGKGNLFGGTLEGGINNCFAGCGTAFELTKKKSSYQFELLYRFEGGSNDVGGVFAPLVMDKKGALYGVGMEGGPSNLGGVFKLTPGKSGYTESVIYFFNNQIGASGAGLAIDNSGNLYGTAAGGTGNCPEGPCGLVFKLAPTKSRYEASVLYSFQNSQDANNPVAALTLDPSSGVIYGTSQFGGTEDNGTVFKLTPSGSGYAESIIYDFSHVPGLSAPEAQLLLGPKGVLYGSAVLQGGGCNGIGCGGVFQLTPSGKQYKFKILFRFALPINGANPEHNGIMMDAKGALYGATRSGGTQTQCYNGGPGGALGCGTIFKLVR